MKKTVLGMMLLVFLSKIFGFGREMAMGTYFGATVATDIYRAAMSIPNLIIGGMVSSINTAMIPYLNKAAQDGREHAFFKKVMTLIFVMSLALVFLIIIFARPLSYVIVSQFSPAVRDQTVIYMRVLSIVLLLQVIVYSLTGYLQKNGRFFIAASCSIPMNIVIIGGIALARDPSLVHLAVATIVGFSLQLLWVLYPFIKSHFGFTFDLDLKDEYVRGFLVMMLPVALTQASTQINGIVDQSLASGLASGSMSMLYYAAKLQQVFFSILVVSYTSVLFPQQSRLALQENKEDLFKVTRDHLALILMLVIPITFGIMFYGLPITRIAYLRGEFTPEAATTTGWILILGTPMLIAQTIKVTLSNLFFTLDKPRIPMITTYASVGINLILNFILIRFLGVYGLILASTLAAFAGSGLLLIYLKSYFMVKRVHVFTASTVKFFIAGGLMLAVLSLLRIFGLTPSSDIKALVGGALIGALIYFVSLLVLKTPEVYHGIEQAKRVIQRLGSRKR